MYYEGDDIKVGKMGGTCNVLERRKNAYRILAGKPEVNRLLGKLLILRWSFRKLSMRLIVFL
jgi:hypothetical protein